jgi:Phage tail tube protein
MAHGTGLDSQFGMKLESVVGTQVTVDHFYEITAADALLQPTYIESSGVRAGKRFKRVAQVGISRKTVSGSISIPVTMKNMGMIWKWMLGSTGTPVQIGGTTAYKQIHTPGATLMGISATMQLGRPQPSDGTVVPFSYKGCKVTDWEFSVSDGAEAALKITIDGWDEDTATALTAASYTASNDTWNFADCNIFSLGGSVATAGGEMTITGATAISSAITSLTITGTNHLAVDRYGLGNAGVKREQLENDFCTITGSFDGDFNKSQIYDLSAAGTTTAIELDLTGPTISGANKYLCRMIMPAVKFSNPSADISGPDLVSQKGDFTAYDDETNAPFEVKIVSTDTAL